MIKQELLDEMADPDRTIEDLESRATTGEEDRKSCVWMTIYQRFIVDYETECGYEIPVDGYSEGFTYCPHCGLEIVVKKKEYK